MELTNEFSVNATVEETWQVLTDLERVAPCMPGVELQEIDGAEHRGIVKVKVGPMNAQYQGVARFESLDEASHRAVIRAEGRDARGQGTAAATVTATLAAQGAGTHVTIHTDLKLTGRVAQFGRGVLADVSTKLLRDFVAALERDVFAGAGEGEHDAFAATRAAEAEHDVFETMQAEEPDQDVFAVTRAGQRASGVTEAPAAADSPAEASASAPRRVESRAAEPVDLVAAAGSSVMKRFGPAFVAAGLVVAAAIWWLIRS